MRKNRREKKTTKFFSQVRRVTRNIDYLLLGAIVLICIFGVVMVYSASMVAAVDEYGLESYYFFLHQCIAIGIGFVAFFLMAFIPYKLFLIKEINMIIIFGSLAALIAVLFWGDASNGAQSWLYIGGMSIQPAEICKLTVILFLARFFHRNQNKLDTINSAAQPFVVVVLMLVLIAYQPDFGTAVIIFAIVLCIFLASGYDYKKALALIVAIGVAAVAFMGIASEFMSEEKQARMTTYKNPFEYEMDEGYQQVGSLLAIEAGGMTGEGLGESKQKYGYLPEPHTDFIIAIIAEELGFVGVAFVLIMLGIIVFRSLYWAAHSVDQFGRLICVGIASWIAVQTFINMGGAISMIPLTGVTLPFISYGGSSMVILLTSMGIVMSVAVRSNMAREDAERELIHN